MVVKLFHNPSAGDRDHSGKELVSLIESHGYECRYASIKEDGWKQLDDDIGIVAIAGGDGAVRKVCKEILDRKLSDRKLPIAILPFGTANNIATSLGLRASPESIVETWRNARIKALDIGRIAGVGPRPFFIESAGFGIFPNLVNNMKKLDKEPANAGESLDAALEELLRITVEYKARECKLVIDGIDHSGKFLLVEIMNMPYIGPNLNLNPVADPGDGELEVIIIPEDQRGKLASWIKERMEGREPQSSFSTLKGESIAVSWQGIHAHVDDSVIKEKTSFDLTIDVNKGVLDFLVPEG